MSTSSATLCQRKESVAYLQAHNRVSVPHCPHQVICDCEVIGWTNECEKEKKKDELNSHAKRTREHSLPSSTRTR